MGATSIAALVAGVAGLAYALIARWSRNNTQEELGEAKALLGASYDRIKELEGALKRANAPIPSDADFVDRVRRMREASARRRRV